MTKKRARLKFPRLRRIDLQRFSLYTLQPTVSLTMARGVTCVAGANGVGKSTLLAAVNFAITGRVPDPARNYKTADHYYQDSLTFTAEFFEGRIDEKDRKAAAIGVELEIGDHVFALTRDIFEPNALRHLRITREKQGTEEVVFDGADESGTDRQAQYTDKLTRVMGLKSFAQFVFIQHFILTFDESRNLLFWDEKALEAALFLAFGDEPQQHQTADTYRDNMNREDSRARNTKWQASRVQKRINDIRATLEPRDQSKDLMALEAQFQLLEDQESKATEAVEKAELRFRDADIKVTDASAAHVGLRTAYSKTFADHVGAHSLAAQHPIVLEAMSDEAHCRICGREGDAVVQVVTRKVTAHQCPLCEGALARPGQKKKSNLEKLREIDEQIATAKESLDRAIQTRDRCAQALEATRRRAAEVNAQVRKFEDEHAAVARSVRGRRAAESNGVAEELDRLEKEARTLLQQSRSEYAERDKWKLKLQELQRSLQEHYRHTEEEFVPLFRELAESFLGIKLDINVETRATVTTSLVLEMRSAPRRGQHQLSESQRFFLDIALRMALAQFASDPATPATLFIDTPEGSLDIAYEARAGEMFAKFVKSGHDLLMTANVNTSQLLKKLARGSGASRMKLVKMTEWTELSDVQIEEEELFRQAYAGIEDALSEGSHGENMAALSKPQTNVRIGKERRKRGR